MPNAYIRLEKAAEFPSHIRQLALKDTSNAGPDLCPDGATSEKPSA
jgi:hypothetical protein